MPGCPGTPDVMMMKMRPAGKMAPMMEKGKKMVKAAKKLVKGSVAMKERMKKLRDMRKK